MSAVTDAPVTPAAVWSIIQGYTGYWVSNAAVQLGVFAALADGSARTAHELATELAAAPAQLEVLLDALVGVGLLERSDAGYALSEVSRRFLVPGGESYMGDLLVHSPGRHENWPLLAGTVSSGVPVFPVDEDTVFWRTLARATFTTQHALAARTAELAGLHGDAALRILDVGAGAAPWAIALLQALPHAHAVANDLPDVVGLAEEQAGRLGVGDRLATRGGDYRSVVLAPGDFDVVVLANVVRTEGADRAPLLLARAANWLRPGGTLVIADYFVDAGGRGSTAALLLGATMMANTINGRTFTEQRFRGWLHDAGLPDVEVLEPIPGARVMLARRGGRRDG